uniref:Ribosome-inactivating protein n=1 Tax=Zea mays TaxID=4577 RepID=UPI0001AF80B7|nr:Chain A, Ribosome-inactivating protein [Zea mays]
MKRIVPKFTEIFPVEDANYPYSAFIASVRKDVIKHCTDHKGIFQPVLPPEKKVPELWLYTELKTRTSSITLAIRMDNLYLVGFRTPGGVWWEFGKDGDTHLLGDNPRWLGFGGRYQDLIGNKGLETVTMGRAEMTRAVNDLAKKKKMLEPQADTKSKLVKLVVMVCEGLRFNTVSRTVDAGFNSQHGVTLTVTQGKQVQKWDRISKAAFEWADHPTAVIPDMQKLGIKDKNEAARIVALVKNQTTAAA